MRHRIPFVAGLVAAIVALVFAGTTSAWASGVEIQEQGQGVGNSFAGAQAVAEDASTLWWNPAGMTRIERHAVAISGSAIWARGDFRDQGSFRAPGLSFTGESGRSDEVIPIGSLYGVYSINKCLKVGLAINAPFGLVTDYGETWIGRYYATRSALTTININPSIAYRFHRNWSVAVGFNAMYAHAELGNMIDFGALAQAPQALDGKVDVEGENWGFGGNIGLLWEPTPCTRVGLHYRSRVKQTLEGTADFTVPPPAAGISAATGRFVDTDATASITMPDQVGLGFSHDFGRRWTVLASVVWTGWSSFDELRVKFANPAEPDAVTPLDWTDTWRVALGAIYRPSSCWRLRIGTQWDQTPIPDDTRTPRIPLSDRVWASAGVGYDFSRACSLELGYAHIFVSQGDMDLASPAAGFLRGYMDGATDIVTLQFNWNF